MREGWMKAAVMTGLGKMEIEERRIPVPASGEALVKLEYVGICGSDLHYFESGRLGNRIVKPPFILGHEGGGVVTAVGDGVTNVKPGDRVALEPGRPCWKCPTCRSGHYNLCKNVAFFGSPTTDGLFREYVAHDATLCFPLPDNVSTMDGALVEPLAVAFYGAIIAGAGIGMTAAVTGAGCIGLASLIALKAMGLSTIYVTDIEQKRLDKACALGATDVVNAAKTDAVEAIDTLTGGAGVDLVIETAGTEITTVQAIRMTRKGATIMLIGQSPGGALSLPVTDAIAKELTFKTIFRYRHVYPTVIEAVANGKANLRDVVTNIYPFEDIKIALEQSINDKANIIKSVIRM